MVKDFAEARERILEQINDLPEEQATALREKIEGMNDKEFENFLKQMAVPLQECIFCQIAQGKIPTIKIYESQNILAVLDINPVSRGHVLVMPKQHYQFLTQLPNELLFEIVSFVKHIIPAIIQTVKSQGVTINILQGMNQAVPHVAVNIIPRFKSDKLNFTWKRLKLPRKELEDIAAGIIAKGQERAKQTAEKKEKIEKEEAPQNEEEAAGNAEISDEEMDKFFRGRIPH
jgi:histidine triad (HIT) family protein